MRGRVVPFLSLCLCVFSSAACLGTSGEPDDGETDAGPEPPEPPPVICKEPQALGAGPYFTEVTDQTGIAFSPVGDLLEDARALYGDERKIADGLVSTGVSAHSADLNGDGWIDIVIHLHPSAPVLRDPLTQDDSHRFRRVLYARPGAPGTFPTFEEMTEPSGYVTPREGEGGRASNAAIFGDVNNDGSPDILSVFNEDVNVRSPDRTEVLLNDGAGVFAFAPQSGPSEDSLALHTATFLDYDLDGVLDVFLGFWYATYGVSPLGRQNRLFRGAGDGTFVDVTDEVGLTTEGTLDALATNTNHKPTFGLTSCDVDRDGDPDLLTSTYGRDMNHLWRNDGGTFTEIGRETGYAADDNHDFTDNQFYLCHCESTGACEADPPQIACPAGRTWTDGADDQFYRLGGNTFTTICEDLDDDGDFDVVNGEIRHWWAGSSSDITRPLMQEPGGDAGFRFARPDIADIGFEQPHHTVDWNEGNIHVGAFDFDNDGRKDVYVGSSDYPDTDGLLYRRTDEGRYEELSEEAGVRVPRTHGMSLPDLDHDGDRDLVTTISIFRDAGPYTIPVVRFFRNDVGQDSNWTAIRLHGAGEGHANASGIGAVVEVVTGDHTQVVTMDGGHGIGGQQHGLVAWIGLGDACTIDELRVHWPDAAHSVSTFTGVQANYYLDVVQGEPFVRYEYDPPAE